MRKGGRSAGKSNTNAISFSPARSTPGGNLVACERHSGPGRTRPTSRPLTITCTVSTSRPRLCRYRCRPAGSATLTLSEARSPTAHRPERSAMNQPSWRRNDSLSRCIAEMLRVSASWNLRSRTNSFSTKRADLACSGDRPWVGSERSSPPHDKTTIRQSSALSRRASDRRDTTVRFIGRKSCRL